MQHQALLESYLRQLKLPTFQVNYQAYATDAARANLPYERFLLALCEAEMGSRQAHRIERAIAFARFPILKDLSTYDFSAVQNISKARVLELAQGGYIAKAEPIILIGNPGLGKTHVATGLALAGCRARSPCALPRGCGPHQRSASSTKRSSPFSFHGSI
jgi:DNA replication protein DnaC